ncbi:MAG: L-rhamnose mutarotase [Anaerolineaceae bacterium]|nr:L-rhamnose mutarotase [Anaerolineaceae bacterium]
MQRIGFLLKVKQDRIEEYKKRHQEVWPDMLEALSRTGWHNYSLFLAEDGMLFGYFETPVSLEEAVKGMNNEEVNARWQTQMAPFFENIGGKHADEGLLQLEQVFYLK